MSPNTIENFYPVYMENRETQVYFKDVDGEAVIVGVNTPEFEMLNGRFDAYVESQKEVEAPSEEVSAPTVAPVTENTEVVEVIAPESTETAPEAPIAPENAVLDEVVVEETVVDNVVEDVVVEAPSEANEPQN